MNDSFIQVFLKAVRYTDLLSKQINIVLYIKIRRMVIPVNDNCSKEEYNCLFKIKDLLKNVRQIGFLCYLSDAVFYEL